MVQLQPWFKEQWIKKTTKDAFVAWGLKNQPQYNAAELEWIYDSHVTPAPIISPITTPTIAENQETPIEKIEEKLHKLEEEVNSLEHGDSISGTETMAGNPGATD